jgi:hypothetical protein
MIPDITVLITYEIETAGLMLYRAARRIIQEQLFKKVYFKEKKLINRGVNYGSFIPFLRKAN